MTREEKNDIKLGIKLDRIDVVKDGSIGYVSLWLTYQKHPEMFCGIEAEYLSKETDPRNFNYFFELRKFYRRNKHLWDPLKPL